MGVISENNLIFVPNAGALENLNEQHVTTAYRRIIKIIIPTKHIILTFDVPNYPSKIKAESLNFPIWPYIPNPSRCFICQKFGHSKDSCHGTITCARSGEKEHGNEGCTSPAHCINCQKNHPPFCKSCEIWKLEKKIQIACTKQNISYPEARKTVKSRAPNTGISDTWTKWRRNVI